MYVCGGGVYVWLNWHIPVFWQEKGRCCLIKKNNLKNLLLPKLPNNLQCKFMRQNSQLRCSSGHIVSQCYYYQYFYIFVFLKYLFIYILLKNLFFLSGIITISHYSKNNMVFFIRSYYGIIMQNTSQIILRNL